MIAHRKATRRRRKGQALRYAVVGLGWIARDAVLPAFANTRGTAELAALVSGSREKLDALGREHDVERRYTYDEYEECLDSGAIDAVYIALPNHLHRDYAVRAAEHGVHVLCEKPLAVTEEECVEIIDAAETNDVKLMTAYRLHFEAANLRAVDIVAGGKIGEPRFFTSVFASQVMDPDNIRVKQETGGGSLYDLGIYCINAARYLFQDEPTMVSAFSARSQNDKRFAEVDEMTAATLRFPGDRLATFVSSFGGANHASFRVVGTEGDLAVDEAYRFDAEIRHTLTVGGRTTHRTFPRRDQFAAQLIHFADCIRSDDAPEPGGYEGLADVHIIRALYESADTNQPVTLDEHTLAMAGRTRPTLEQEIRRPPVG